ncbi:hypothetical protein MSPP1_002218 [Malassezia sp. CBS 17886]|nr:hypothetical protein MSPP1_002218 [Malassezia sp. CBS 17886]
MKAIVLGEKGQASIQEVETPKPGAGQVLLRVHDVALNPTDWKTIDIRHISMHISGSDAVGTVAEKGDNADLEIGERVAGLVPGAFAQYQVIHPGSVITVPDFVPDQDAPSLGVSACTAYFALFQPKHLGLRPPTELQTSVMPVDPKKKILVWSGATNAGQYAVKLARIVGMYVIVTASPKQHEFLKSIGASETYDYHDKSVSEKIHDAHPDLAYGFDTFSEKGSIEAVYRAMSTTVPGKMAHLLPAPKDIQKENPKVQGTFVLLYTTSGREINTLGAHFDEAYCQEDMRYLGEITSGKKGILHHLLATRLLKLNPAKLMPDGLEGVLKGLDLLRQNKVSGEKLVYRVCAST